MKNPFELRYDLLALAHDQLQEQYTANVELAQKLIAQAVEAGQLYLDAYNKFMPKFPSAEEILKEAQKFYNFVNGK